MNFIREKLTDDFIKNTFAVILLILLLIAATPFKNLLLLTFIFTFIFSRIQNSIYTKIEKTIRINKKIITIFLFMLLIALVVISLLIYVPKLSNEIVLMKKDFVSIISSNENPIIKKYSTQILNWDYVSYFRNNSDTTLRTLSEVQKGAVSFFLSIILSLFILLEEKKIKELGTKLSKSKLEFFYNYYKNLGKKFLNSFGKVIQVQLTIAMINSVLSLIGLMILGFPEPIALGFMIFVFSLIPVLGVTISLIPLCLIAFKIGGINKIIAVLILIAILHALESYVINPKLMSDKAHLPIFITFLALIIGEHLLGVWGLLISIPLLMFFMDIFEVK